MVSAPSAQDTSSSAVTVLYGAQSDGTALSYFLEFNGVNILLDCGWDYKLDPEDLEPLRKVADRVDVILISHADIAHMGALPYAVATFGLNAPVYATVPTYKMGQMVFYDLCTSLSKLWGPSSPNHKFNLDNVDTAFDLFVEQGIRYRQRCSLKLSSGKKSGVSVVAHRAGRLVGSSIWKIFTETEEVVYAIHYNHAKDRHLDGTEIAERFKRPSILITDSYNATYNEPSSLRKRERELVDAVVGAVRQGGNVLLPCDTAGRVLELALILDDYWTRHRLGYRLILVNHVAKTTVDFARSQLEWMGTAVNARFSSSRTNPFNFRHVRVLPSIEAAEALTGIKVILASDTSLEFGVARKLFFNWASRKRARILFTSRPAPGSLGDTLLRASVPCKLQVKNYREVKLRGEECMFYYQFQIVLIHWRQEQLEAKQKREEEEEEARLRREEEEEEAAAVGRSGKGVESDSDSDADSGEDSDEDATGLGSFKIRLRGAAFLRRLRRPRLLFPLRLKRKQWDEWGEIINTADYTISEGKDTGNSNTTNDSDNKNLITGTVDISNIGTDGDEQLQQHIQLQQEAKQKVVRATKWIAIDEEVNVTCHIAMVDLEGRSDGRSMRSLLEAIAPRRIILVSGAPENTGALLKHCEEAPWAGGGVWAPNKGERIVIESDVSLFKVSVQKKLLQHAAFQKVGAYSVSFLRCCVRPPGSDDVDIPSLSKDLTLMDVDDATDKVNNTSELPLLSLLSLGETWEELPSVSPQQSKQDTIKEEPKKKTKQKKSKTEVDVALQEATIDTTLPPVLLLREQPLRLSDVRKALQAADIPSKFRSGVLLCGKDGSIIVRRVIGDVDDVNIAKSGIGGSGVMVEGLFSVQLLKIRQIVNDLFVHVNTFSE